jgi:hypothetical protein
LIKDVGSQLRLATIPTPDGVITRPVGLDFGAVMMMGAARQVDVATLAEILPRIEAAIVNPDEFGEGDDSGATE